MLTQWVPHLSHRTAVVSGLAAYGSEQGGDCDLWGFFFLCLILATGRDGEGQLEKFLLKSWWL